MRIEGIENSISNENLLEYIKLQIITGWPDVKLTFYTFTGSVFKQSAPIMNGLGKTADRTSSVAKPGAKSRSIYEALLKANGSSIFEMLRQPHGGSSIFEDLRLARFNSGSDSSKQDSILQVDWKKRQ